MKGKDRDLDLVTDSIILVLQRLLLALVTSCTIYVACKSSDPRCAPNLELFARAAHHCSCCYGNKLFPASWEEYFLFL